MAQVQGYPKAKENICMAHVHVHAGTRYVYICNLT